MGLRLWLIILVAAAIGCATPARAQHEPVIVIPGKRGVPVFIEGQEASGAVVYGEFGLDRPGHMAPIVIRRQPWPVVLPYRRCARVVVRRRHAKRVHHVRRVKVVRRKPVVRSARVAPGRRHFFPGGTSPPKLGRLESHAPYAPPKPAESFSRSWSTRSSPTPATISQPPVIVAPVVEDRFRPRRRPRP
jgi:hypothetical protein